MQHLEATLIKKRLTFALLLLALQVPTHAAIPVIVGDKLAGATDVVISGVGYNVQFVDGSCLTAFSGCNASTFLFTKVAHSIAASTALQQQVFVGTFGTDPSLTLGCGSLFFCDVLTPYAYSSAANLVSFSNFHDETELQGPSWGNDYVSEGISFSQTDLSTSVWAAWQMASPVPETSSLILMTIGIALVGLVKQTKRHTE